MRHRAKKQNGLNRAKRVGIGSKFEDKEIPEECNLRDVAEETGLIHNSCRYCGIVPFVADKW